MRIASVGQWVKALVLAASAVTAVGCSSWPKDLNVALDKRVVQEGSAPSVDVHLIGIRQGQLRDYRTMSVTDYWSPGGPSRQPIAARKELFLSPGATSKTVAKKDPIWKQWDGKNRTYLVVLADLRGVSAKGDDDPRRVILPLNKKRWPGGLKAIRVAVRRDRVEVLTPWKPKG